MIYHTGIDVHKERSYVQHMDDDGALGLSLIVPTDQESMEQFLTQIDEPTTITFEASRNYWWLHEFFASHPKVLQVNVVDPRRSRHIAKELSVISGYGRAKTDRIDGEMLAEQTRRGLAPTIHVPTVEQLERRALCRHRFLTVRFRTRAKNILHAILALHGVSVSIDSLLEDASRKATVLRGLPPYIPIIMDQLLAQIRLFNQQIDRLDTELALRLPASHSQIQLLITVPGIGIVLSRIIATEILSIDYFRHHKYLISYSGLAPIIHESDRRKGMVTLNRHCNHFLKYAFVEAAHNAHDHINYRRKYELDLKRHGKMIAKLNLARRLAKTVYWMLTRQQPYNK